MDVMSHKSKNGKKKKSQTSYFKSHLIFFFPEGIVFNQIELQGVCMFVWGGSVKLGVSSSFLIYISAISCSFIY